MIILCGASASGKTEICKMLCLTYGFKKFITTTTRPIRVNETKDVDYHFRTIEEFLQMQKENKFIETSFYNGNWYGTEKREINDNVILIVDINGLNSFTNLKDEHIVSFFLECDEAIRYERMINRLDDKENANKRIINDRQKFDKSLIKHIDYTIDTSTESIINLSNTIYKLYKNQ